MTLKGKGFFIWKIINCESGDHLAITNLAHQSNLTHVLVKVADRNYSYNVDSEGVDLVPPLVQNLHGRGIQAWGWHYIYGDDPIGEANKAIQRIQQTAVDGYVLDVEGEFKEPGKDQAAKIFMDRLRAVFPDLPIALCSYRFPSYHPQIPWEIFLDKCNYNMPQVYWLFNHNPGDQLSRCVQEFQSITPYRPIIPVGSAYKTGSWTPIPADMEEFMGTAQSLNLPGANFWEWSNCREYLPEVWGAIGDYSWPTTPPPADITVRYIEALNSHDPDQVTSLYTPDAVHVTPARTVQGTAAIRSWYQSFFNYLLPNASFVHTGFSGVGSSRHFTWTAESSQGKVKNGSDTLGLLEGKIAYHF
jgi:hypothetical protein